MIVVVYTDEGPAGPCGQAMSATRPWCRAYLFDSRQAADLYLRDNPLPGKGRRRPRVEILGEDDGDGLRDERKPPPGSPLSPGRLAEIRDDDRLAQRWSLDLVRQERRDLLRYADFLRARLDEAECLLADAAQDQGARMGRADGVAAALAALERLRGTFTPGDPWHSALSLALGHVRTGSLKEDYDPPPHSRSLARLRRLEEALGRILYETRIIDLNDANKVMHCEQIAREVLKEDA